MKKFLSILLLSSSLFVSTGDPLRAQTLEWRLVNPTYSAVDPDGAGPATGSATFGLQIHATNTTVNNINTISLGWSYQSANALVPTAVGCTISSSPANVVVSPAFVAGGFSYTVVNQCGLFSQSTGGQAFDRRVVGTLDGNSISITNTWIDVFTITLWSLNSAPNAGYVVINSGAGGNPAPFNTYAASNIAANEFVVNSLTYTAPLLLAQNALPVTFSKFNVTCTDAGTLLNWETLTEDKNDRYVIEKSLDTRVWNTIATIAGAGTSTSVKQYSFTDTHIDKGAYYRLRQVDVDGRATYTPVRQSACAKGKGNMYIYPVPATGILNVEFNSATTGTSRLKIIDGAGRICYSRDLLRTLGLNKIQLNTSNLSTGNYVLSIEYGDHVEVKKFTVSH